MYFLGISCATLYRPRLSYNWDVKAISEKRAVVEKVAKNLLIWDVKDLAESGLPNWLKKFQF